jgi:hypothetical protein
MTDLRTAALRALEALEAWEDAAPSQWTTRDEKTIATLREALAQPEDKSQAAFEHWVETVEATQGCAISRNAVVDKLLTVTPAQMAHAEAVEPATINHDYERGFVDGMNHQARSSVDRAVNAMSHAEATCKQDLQVEPVAWRTFDGEGGYEYRTYEDNENYLDKWNKRNPDYPGWVEPLYITPPPCPTCEALARTVIMDQTGRD